MKIYEIGTGYTPIPAQMGAATEIVVEELTKAFLKKGMNVEILDIASESRKYNDLPIREINVPRQFSTTDVQLGIMHKMKRVVYSIALARTLKKILKESDEKIILHFHNQYNLFFFLKLVPKKIREMCTVAYTNHSGIWRLQWKKIESIIRKRYFQEAECMKKADVVFVLNQETKQNILKHLNVPETRINVIANGVNTEKYYPLAAEKKRLAKEKFGFAESRVILQVGSIYENKGQLRSVMRLRPLLKENSELVYAYAGGIVDDEYQRRLLQYARDNNIETQVKYLGMVAPGKELNDLYNAADATICASHFESFGLVIIESAASGVPVLLEQSFPLLLEDGCIRYRAENLCDVVQTRILSDNEAFARLCEAARDNVEKNYSWNKIAADYFTILMKVN